MNKTILDAASWIWIDTNTNPRNKWVVFQRNIHVPDDIYDARIEITADSRYWLYINNERIHKGPNRAFPGSLQYDHMRIDRYLHKGENTIEVYVNHMGMHTHQYIEGRAGFAAAICITTESTTQEIVTDKEWRCTEDTGFLSDRIRISAGREYSELYDARIPEQTWQPVHVIGSVGIEPWGTPVRSILPAPTCERTSARRIIHAHTVQPSGKTVHVDLHDICIGEVKSPEFLYVVTRIHAKKDIDCDMSFMYSRLWCVYGECMINGRLYASEMNDYVLNPIADGTGAYHIHLDKGDNLFAMRINNMAMGMHFGLHLTCDADDIVFKPMREGHGIFTCATSLLNSDSHHIHVKTGEWMNRPENPLLSAEEKAAAEKECWESLKNGNLQNIRQWIRDISPECISFRHPQYAIMTQEKLHTLPIDRNTENLILDTIDACQLQPSHDKEFLIDFGREVLGYIYLEIDAAEAGEIIDIYGFEYRDRYGKQQEMDGVNNGFRYYTRKGAQKYISFQSRGFRYLNVTIRHTYPLRIKHIGIYHSTFPVTRIGTFTSDDAQLNAIYEMSERTTRLCMQDTFIDCPGHEQSFWIGDFRNEALIALSLYHAKEIIENCHHVALGALQTSPLPKASVPSEPQGITPYALT